MKFNIQKLVRSNLRNRQPYTSARDEFKGEADIYLDANENPFTSETNRYPDPRQKILKEKVAEIKKVSSNNVFIGNGSDEVLDLLFRAFCEPGIDNVIITPPTYGMYEVLAEINNIKIHEANLNPDFSLNISRIKNKTNEKTKLIFLCSPNNPSGNILEEKLIINIIETTNALVVIDEAYIDFTSYKGFLSRINNYPNLVVIQTLSKAWGLAGLRLGLGFASADIIQVLDSIKPPYNVNSFSQKTALKALQNKAKVQNQIQLLMQEKQKIISSLKNLSEVKKIYPSETNFILIEIENATEIYRSLLKKGIVLRNRSGMLYCSSCLRITIGTPDENTRMLSELKDVISHLAKAK